LHKTQVKNSENITLAISKCNMPLRLVLGLKYARQKWLKWSHVIFGGLIYWHMHITQWY